MRRNLDEMLASQEQMLQRRHATAVPRDQIREAYQLHITALLQWLLGQTHMKVTIIDYSELLDNPHMIAAQINAFLGGGLALEPMAQAVDPNLWRNRCNTGNDT